MKRPSAGSTATLLVLAFLYLPIIVVVGDSFNADESLNSWGGATLDWYRTALTDERVRADFVTSLQVAILATILSTIVAVTAGLWARRASPSARRLFDATTYLRIILPEVVIAVGLFLLTRKLQLGLGILPIVIGHVVFCSAYATIVIQARLATMSFVLEEAASDLGASPWRTFRRVTAPSLMPAIIVAALLCFTFSFDDVVSSVFLGGTNAETLPVLILGLVRIHVTPEVNAIGAGVMAITLISFVLIGAVASLRGLAGATPSRRRVESTPEEPPA